jgi:hypothetical protein
MTFKMRPRGGSSAHREDGMGRNEERLSVMERMVVVDMRIAEFLP